MPRRSWGGALGALGPLHALKSSRESLLKSVASRPPCTALPALAALVHMVTSVPKLRVSAAAASLERGCEHALKSCDGTAFCGWSLCYAGWLPPWQSRFFTITHGGALAVWELEPGKQPRSSTPREDPFATLRCTTRVDLRKLSALRRETPDCADNFVFRLVTSTHTLRIDPGNREAFEKWELAALRATWISNSTGRGRRSFEELNELVKKVPGAFTPRTCERVEEESRRITAVEAAAEAEIALAARWLAFFVRKLQRAARARRQRRRFAARQSIAMLLYFTSQRSAAAVQRTVRTMLARRLLARQSRGAQVVQRAARRRLARRQDAARRLQNALRAQLARRLLRAIKESARLKSLCRVRR